MERRAMGPVLSEAVDLGPLRFEALSGRR